MSSPTKSRKHARADTSQDDDSILVKIPRSTSLIVEREQLSDAEKSTSGYTESLRVTIAARCHSAAADNISDDESNVSSEEDIANAEIDRLISKMAMSSSVLRVGGSYVSITVRELAGCLEVRLMDDHDWEVTSFFNVIYDAQHTFNRASQLRASPKGLAMLRLGEKYDAPGMQLEALERFLNSEWDIMANCTNPEEDCGASEILWKPEDAIVFSNLVYNRQRFSGLLSLGLYTCCQLDNERLVKGCQTDIYREQLDPTLMIKVLDARNRLAIRSRDTLSSVPHAGNPKCKNLEMEFMRDRDEGQRRQSRCWKGIPANSLPKTCEETDVLCHPVLKLDQWRKGCLERSLCSDCIAWVEKLFGREKKALVQSLPWLISQCLTNR